MQQSVQPVVVPGGLIPPRRISSYPTTLTCQPQTHQDDDLWCQSVLDVVNQLSLADQKTFLDSNNLQAFTSTQLLKNIPALTTQYEAHTSHKILTRLDPILAHIASFSSIFNNVVQADITVAGMIWGGLSFLIDIACRNQRVLESVLQFLLDMGPQLDLFGRWRRLFPDTQFAELGEAMKAAYKVIIEFYIKTAMYLKRHPMSNLLRVVWQPKIEAGFRYCRTQFERCTKKIKLEVDTAHMQYVQVEIRNISTFITNRPALLHQRDALPCIRLIPHSRNSAFFGRQDTLKAIDSFIGRRQASLQQCCALAGPGGSGKTQVALEYTYQHLADFKVILWILADDNLKIDKSFRDAAELLGLDQTAQNASHAKSLIMQTLASSDEPYLMVFDNADDLSLINDCFPRSNNGSILITTRDEFSASQKYKAVTLSDFEILEACAYLKSQLPESVLPKDPNDQSLQEISTAFHGYPLGLAQVAGFLRTGHCMPTKFLKIFYAQKNSEAIAAMPISDYHATLATVWDLSFASLGNASRLVLEILVYLDPDSIPMELFEDGWSRGDAGQLRMELQDLGNPITFGNVLMELRSQSLVRINTEQRTISVHRSFQEQAYTRHCNDTRRQRSAFENALWLLTNVQPVFNNHKIQWSPGLWKISETYMPHINSMLARFSKTPLIFQGYENQLAKLMFHCGTYQFERSFFNLASQTFDSTRKVIQMSRAPDILLLADCFRVEGRMYNENNQALRAAASGRDALTHTKIAVEIGLVEPNDCRLPRILTVLGNSLSQLGQLDAALEMQTQALRLCWNGDGVSDTLDVVQLNLGFLYLRRNELDDAERYLLAVVHKNPQAAWARYPLGMVYLARDKVDDALAEFTQSLKIYVDTFGEFHDITADGMYKVGEVLLLHKNNANQAEAYLTRSLHVYKERGEDYDNRASRARNCRMLAKALSQLERHDEASKLFQEAWNLRLEVEGIRGSDSDSDSDYTNLLFYWAH